MGRWDPASLRTFRGAGRVRRAEVARGVYGGSIVRQHARVYKSGNVKLCPPIRWRWLREFGKRYALAVGRESLPPRAQLDHNGFSWTVGGVGRSVLQ